MSSVRSTHIVSETEQLLFYSIPGSTFLLYCALFLFLFDGLPISTGHAAGAALASIPIGFLLYQAYTANFLWVYERVNRREEETTLKFLEDMLRDSGVTFLDDEGLYRLSKRVLTYVENTTPEADYIWRLVDIVNSRGACLFSTLIASVIPISYVFSCTLSLFDIATICTLVGLSKVTLFYIVLLTCGFCLYRGIPKVKAQLDIYNGFLVCQNVEKVKTLAKSYSEVKSTKAR